MLQVLSKVAKELLRKPETASETRSGLLQKRNYNLLRSEDVPHDPHQQAGFSNSLTFESCLPPGRPCGTGMQFGTWVTCNKTRGCYLVAGGIPAELEQKRGCGGGHPTL